MSTEAKPCPAAIIAWLTARGIRVRVHGALLQAGPAAKLTGDVRALLVEYGPLIAEHLRGDKPILSVVSSEPGEAGRWADHPWPTACPKCGRHDRWEDRQGGEHCTTCDPPAQTLRWLDLGACIRRRLGLPEPTKARQLFAIVQAECLRSDVAGETATDTVDRERPARARR